MTQEQSNTDNAVAQLAAVLAAQTAGAADGAKGGALDAVAGLVPDRSRTVVKDFLNSPEMLAFEAQWQQGMVETAVISQVMNKLMDVLPLLIAGGL